MPARHVFKSPNFNLRSGFERVRSFVTKTDGAVTVDWTIMAAAVVGIGIASVTYVRSGSGALGDDVQSSLTNASVAFISGVDLSQEIGAIWSPLTGYYDLLRPQTAAMTDEDLYNWLVYYSEFMTDPSLGANTGFTQDVYRDVYAVLQVEYEERGNTVPDGYYDLRDYLAVI